MFLYRRVITHETPSALVSALGPSNTAVRTVVVVAHLKKLRRPRTGSVVAVSRRAPGSRRQVSASYTVTSGRSAVFGVGKSAAWTAQSGLASRGSDPRGLYLWFIPFRSWGYAPPPDVSRRDVSERTKRRAPRTPHPRSCSADLRLIARIPFPVPADHETFRRAGDGCARGGQARGARGPDERQGADEGFVKELRAAPARCERGGRAAAPTRQGTARGAETG